MRKKLSTNPVFHTQFWQRARVSDTCWLWTGRCDPDGYGRTYCDGKVMGVHRVAWVLTHGPIPNGMYVCHNCPGGDNPACINPAHLWLGTNADNLRDMDAKGRRVNRRGERHYRARLTDENVRAIRQHRAEGWSYRRIAAEFDIAPGNAHRIATYQQWKHVT